MAAILLAAEMFGTSLGSSLVASLDVVARSMFGCFAGFRFPFKPRVFGILPGAHRDD